MKTKLKKQYSDNRKEVLISHVYNQLQSAARVNKQLLVVISKTSFKAISECFLYFVHFIFNASICLSAVSIGRSV